MTTLKKFAAVVRLNIRLQLMDPTPTLILSIFPLVMIPFMEPAFKSMLLSDGYTNVTGVEQAIPGMAIFFSFLSVQTIIQSFFVWKRPQLLKAQFLQEKRLLLTSYKLSKFLPFLVSAH